MRRNLAFKIALLLAANCMVLPGQPTPAKDVQPEAKGLPPRAAPADYQTQAQAGTLTIAAEFTGHSVPTLQDPLSTEEYVVVELGLFGPPGARIKLDTEDFSLRINGKKSLPGQSYGPVLASIKDPQLEPPSKDASKSKTSVGGNEKSDSMDHNLPPPPPKIPIGVQRAMAQRVQRASLPEGDRALPQAGLVFFPYHGKAQSIHSVELIYSGPAGKATLTLQP